MHSMVFIDETMRIPKAYIRSELVLKSIGIYKVGENFKG